MSRKYKFRDNSMLYFVSFAVINRIEAFIRKEYKQILLDSLEYCQKFKELELHRRRLHLEVWRGGSVTRRNSKRASIKKVFFIP